MIYEINYYGKWKEMYYSLTELLYATTLPH